MAGFRIDFFKGIRPRISKRKLPVGEAQTAENLKLGSADLDPWAENSIEQAVVDSYNNRSIFLYPNNDNPVWFEWSNFVDVARGPIKGDSLERIYYTGDGVPKITWNELQGAPPYPSASYDLGVPKPTTRLTAAGQELPEDLDPSLRRTSTASGERPSTFSFEIVSADFTVYPGTGTPNDTWRLDATALGDIHFQVDVGDTFKVLEVLDVDTVTLGSNTGTGAVAATAANDKTSVNYWHPMDEQGSTQAADFIGWRIPDGLRVTIAGHRLRVGDVIRVTRNDQSFGLNWTWSLTGDLFELDSGGGAGGWGVPVQDPDTLVYQHKSVLLGKDVNGQTLFELGGGFYYTVDRASSDNDTLEDRTYVYTYVSTLGEEGPPSDPSSLVAALDGDSVTLTGFDLAPAGSRDISLVRIYRTNATAVGTEYQFVREVSFADILAQAGAVVDTVEAAALGEIIESTTWFPPDSEMQGITTMPNGMMVGFKGNNIYFCEPYQPHAWPPEYDQAVDFEVVGLAPFGNSVAVLTEGTPYVITGSHPRNANIRPYKINQACMYKESIATANDKVYYASPDGIVQIGVNGARIVSAPFVTKKEWALFQPELMVGEFHDGLYYGFFGADNTVTPQPTGSVAVTGTILDFIYEEDIVAGGKTIILTLTDETWAAAGSAFNNARAAIIFSITGSGTELFGWNNVRATIPVTDVVRTSDTVVTITLSAIPTYSISANETLTFKAPASALAGSAQLTAPEEATLLADRTYSAQALVLTSASTADDLPVIVYADGNIGDWRDATAPAGVVAADGVYFTDASYHKTLGRWAVTGYNSQGATANNPVIITSDNIVDAETSWVKRTTPASANFSPARSIIYDDYTDNFFVGCNAGSLLYSANGINWLAGALPSPFVGQNLIKFARAPGGTTKRIYGMFENSLKLAMSADLDSPLNTTWVDLGDVPNGGTAVSSITSGNGLVLVANDEATAEIGYIDHGETTYTEIGNLGMDVSDLTYGAGRFVAISANGRIQYVDKDSEKTIGNWSAVSAAIDGAGTRDLAKIEYDEGDASSGLPGYGFIATLSASGVPGDVVTYTSEDAIVWTLRDTLSNTSDALGIGVTYPESDLGEVLAVSGVNIDGGTFITFSRSSSPATNTQRLIVRADGYISEQKVRGSSTSAETIIDAATDWIIPHFAADGTYDVQISNITGAVGDYTGPVEDAWTPLSSDVQFAVTCSGATSAAYITFTLSIRKDSGAVLASGEFTLGAEITGFF
jgi:hypothetical protein